MQPVMLQRYTTTAITHTILRSVEKKKKLVTIALTDYTDDNENARYPFVTDIYSQHIYADSNVANDICWTFLDGKKSWTAGVDCWRLRCCWCRLLFVDCNLLSTLTLFYHFVIC